MDRHVGAPAPERRNGSSRGTQPVFRQGEPGSALEECLAAAIMAPSVHNTQPWLFHPHHRAVDVYADRDRQLMVADPNGRELFLSVGAAVFNLRLAVLQRGRLPELRLRPEPDSSDLLARVTPGRPARASPTMRTLARAMPRRRSNRWPFTDLSVPTPVLAELVAAAAAEGALLKVADPHSRRAILRLVYEADRHWSADPAYRQELTEWTRPCPGRSDGVTTAASGPRRAGDALPVRDFGLTRAHPDRQAMTFEARPTIAVLYTRDTPAAWLRAGQALQRVLLTATVRGLSTSMLTQPLEIVRLRAQLTDPASGRTAQAIIRLGYSLRPGAASRRRTLADVLVADAPRSVRQYAGTGAQPLPGTSPR